MSARDDFAERVRGLMVYQQIPNGWNRALVTVAEMVRASDLVSEADLRAKVEGLVDIAAREFEQSDYCDYEAHAREVAYSTVLALLEGKP